MKTLRILVDMDEITVNLMSDWLRIYNQEWNDNLTHDKILDWDVHQFVKPECGKKIYQILKRPGLFDYLPPMPGAVDSITELVKAGHDVRFATAPPSSDAARGKIEWVLRNFGHLDFKIDHVMQLHDKAWINADVLVDDKPDTIKKWHMLDRGFGNDPVVMAIAHPWNTNCSDIADVYAKSYKEPEKAWKTIVSAIHKLSKKGEK